MPKSNGIFIVMEGIDGAGKTTQSNLLYNWLENLGKTPLLAHELKREQDEDISQIIKSKILSNEEVYQPETTALWFAINRMTYLKKVVLPALEKGKIVILERYYHSSLAYQSTQGASFEWIEDINKYTLTPNVTFILDVPTEEAINRIKSRKETSKNIFENKEFLKKVKNKFKKLKNKLDEPLFLINGNKEKNEVHEEIKEVLGKKYSEFK